jgi:TonB family protein
VEASVQEGKSTSNPGVEPKLPAPKVVAAAPPRVSRVGETSPDSLVQLPTKASTSNLSSLASSSASSAGSAVKETGFGEGIRALKEGAQIPGALKGTGSGAGPYGVPGGISRGRGTTGGGTGVGVGGGSSSGLKGRFNVDYDQYLEAVKKRVNNFWKFPQGDSGVQRVRVRFTLDRSGRLTMAEIVDSTDSKINASALEAMKKASPFPPIPETLRDLAGYPIILVFETVDRIKG